jgi:hypothetical protein
MYSALASHLAALMQCWNVGMKNGEMATPSSAKAALTLPTDLSSGSSGDGPIREVATAISSEPASMIQPEVRGQQSMNQPRKGAVIR